MRIAILGWGSLLWDDDEVFDRHREKEWRREGPTVRLEFSRISKKRSGALTLVIDDEHGDPTEVSWCLSKRRVIADAISDLSRREETPRRNIGSTEDHGPGRSRAAIVQWAEDKDIDAVLWTGLESNFEKKTGKKFSTEAAIEHLQGLPAEGKAKAAEYVWRAPRFVETPLRRAVEVRPWFPKMAT